MDRFSLGFGLGGNGSDPNTGLPPGQVYKYEGPWFTTQLALSLSIGLCSFLAFCVVRRVERFKVLYRPRTLLKGFSPHQVHDSQSLFGWVLPTLRTSEFTVLQIVGLDAAVLLLFLRTCFLFFLTASILVWSILVPINYRENGSSEGVRPGAPEDGHHHHDEEDKTALLLQFALGKVQHGSTLYLTSHLVFTYALTILALVFLHRSWRRYIPLRQLFSLEHAHAIPARTVLVTDLPPHLRSEKALADYFESIHLNEAHEAPSGLGVDSVVVTRAVGGMKELLHERTKALMALEKAWVDWLGNPVPVPVEGGSLSVLLGKASDVDICVKGYDPKVEVERILQPGASPSTTPTRDRSPERGTSGGAREGRLIHTFDGPDDDDDDDDLEARLLEPARAKIVHPKKPRPTTRLGWFGKRVDKLDHLAAKFREADEQVRKRRRGRFRPTGVAFVTFQSLAAAQIAAQAVHYPSATAFKTELAPEPRDIQWSNLALSNTSVFVRRVLVLVTLLVLLSVWSVPVAYLAKLLSWDTIEETAPRLAKFIAKSPRLRGFVQTSLPSLAMVSFNNLLPLFLGELSVLSGLSARSWIEYSTLKKYHVSLLFTTLFVFITSSTYSLLQGISESPARALDKLATTLPGARNFFVSYVMLAGLALMPLQLLELAMILLRGWTKLFWTKTPRDHAQLNSPTTVNLGTVYPRVRRALIRTALLIFTLGVTYSIISPLILPFATLYFGIAYLVYKYKFLFVFYRPYESRGQAWPLAFNRSGWGLLIFQVFMLGLLTVRKAFLLSGLVIPLILGTSYTIYRLSATYTPLSRFVNLSQACQVSHGATADIVKLRRGHPVTRSQTHLSRGRYQPHSSTNEGVYVVARNEATDYDQPPLSDVYGGVLNTGARLYNHPALAGALPEPWLPVIKTREDQVQVPDAVQEALHGTVVVDLRRRWSIAKNALRKKAARVKAGKRATTSSDEGDGRGDDDDGAREIRVRSIESDDPSRAWRGSRESTPEPLYGSNRRDTDDEADEDEQDQGTDEDQPEPGSTRYGTYFHRRDGGETFPPGSGSGTGTGENSDAETV
ncbi:BZ3500_MvSof-1268-A1-R1_Chr4-1g06692 [Microbotryum saponariae]|uniref:BZ3500_MvSof-1268-A1-R1_Chr4-1g06692 protein n=1 Tax=Microbotryum saponariae TaxID=289078 RepID=A0A2X0NL59_9BASI|nr:BZ3500_MvSof-1268-A1-R1_Chr4-1g06692 [Microbotryum saponariae]SDA06357.1 BZ3501_MvSof-1269-A2-R1_Chr4-1g06402 [Microbotryum saponariae]